LFILREAGRQDSLYSVSLSLRTVAPPPCLPLDIKDLLKEDVRVFDEVFLMGDGLIGWQLARGLLQNDTGCGG
jgi:hypothetical protein